MDSAHDFISAHHEHLAAWLRDGDTRSLDAFLSAHHGDFSLVTTTGEILDLAALRLSLSGVGGTQPGLRVAIDDVTTMSPEAHRFVERHVVNGTLVDVRVVTVVMRDGLVIGLQETARRR